MESNKTKREIGTKVGVRARERGRVIVRVRVRIKIRKKESGTAKRHDKVKAR